METVQNGQCGLCTHFGEHHKTGVLVSILSGHQADLKMVDECGHPKHADIHLSFMEGAGAFGPLNTGYKSGLALAAGLPQSHAPRSFKRGESGILEHGL